MPTKLSIDTDKSRKTVLTDIYPKRALEACRALLADNK